MNSRLIVIEGGDGAGKATQVELLVKSLRRAGKKVASFDIPDYDEYWGKLVGRYLSGEFGTDVSPYLASILYAQNRLSMKDRIYSALHQGKIVILNRYVTSNIAYMAAKLKPKDQERFITWIQDLEYKRNALPKPDLVILLDVPPQIGQKLVLKKGKRSYTTLKRDIHERNLRYLKEVERVYRRLAKKGHWVIIPCVKDGKIQPKDVISRNISSEIRRFLRF